MEVSEDEPGEEKPRFLSALNHDRLSGPPAGSCSGGFPSTHAVTIPAVTRGRSSYPLLIPTEAEAGGAHLALSAGPHVGSRNRNWGSGELLIRSRPCAVGGYRVTAPYPLPSDLLQAGFLGGLLEGQVGSLGRWPQAVGSEVCFHVWSAHCPFVHSASHYCVFRAKLCVCWDTEFGTMISQGTGPYFRAPGSPGAGS